MNILPGALPNTHIPDPVMVARLDPTAPPAVTAAQAAGRSHNQANNQASNQQKNSRSGTTPGKGGPNKRGWPAIGPPPDPNRPTGPSPAFEANLLETERERLLKGPEPDQNGRPGAPAAPKNAADTAPVRDSRSSPPSAPFSPPPPPTGTGLDITL